MLHWYARMTSKDQRGRSCTTFSPINRNEIRPPLGICSKGFSNRLNFFNMPSNNFYSNWFVSNSSRAIYEIKHAFQIIKFIMPRR